MSRSSFLPWCCAALAVVFVGCANSGGDGPVGMDGSTRDTGPMMADCGNVGQACCAGSTRCMTGAVCGSDRTCCAVPNGASCRNQDDCCGTLDCLAGECCAVPGSPCRTSSECCGDGTCNEGMCQAPRDDCGGEGQMCCDGECSGGHECVDDRCIPCGDDGEACCRPPNQCKTDLICNGDGQCEPVPADCGGEGESCCATGGSECSGSLECDEDEGVCRAPPTDCSQTTCGSCTSSVGGNCGWCGASSMCMEGNASGPTAGSCSTDWEYGSGACATAPDNCPTNTECGACTRDLSGGSGNYCGWCANSNSCHRGTSGGPADGSCSGADWDWISSQCGMMPPPMDNCAMNSACDACTRDLSGGPGNYCGWCANTGMCERGTSAGPADSSCSGADWDYLPSACAPPADPCRSNTDCASCAGTSGCGFCVGTMTCRSGTSTGSTDGACMGSGWRWTTASCMPAMCSMVQGACTMDSNCCMNPMFTCRRGVTFSTRCCAESMTTCTGGGDCCGYMDCVSGMCQCRAAGRACLENGDCCSGTCSGGVCT